MSCRPDVKVLLVAVFVSFLTRTAAAEERGNLVFFNGRIFTSDAAKPWAEAIAIRGNRITALGSSREVLATAPDGARRVDLHGRLVIPGINDADAQFDPKPQTFVLGTTPDSSVKDVLIALGSGSDETAGDVWISATIGERTLRDSALMAAALDKAAGGRKAVLTSPGGHDCVFSAAALAALHVRESVGNPVGGSFERDAEGHLTGRASEYACFDLDRLLADTIADDEAIEALRALSSQALRIGITSVQLTSTLPMPRLEKIIRHADLPLRMRIVHLPWTSEQTRDASDEDAGPARHRERPLTIIAGRKWILDGTAGGEHAALRQPYHAGSDQSGSLNFATAEIPKILSESLAAGDQPIFEAHGDRAISTLFDAMKTIPNVDWKSKRVQIAQGDGLLPDLLPVAKSLGVVVVQDPSRLSDAKLYPSTGYVPLKSLLSAGIPLAFGSGREMNPFRGIALATTFAERPSEAITRAEAVEAYTRGSAFVESAENEKGTIAVGKLADLAVLSQDIFKVPAAQIADTVSLLTIVDGKVVYEGGPLAPPEPAKGMVAPRP